MNKHRRLSLFAILALILTLCSLPSSNSRAQGGTRTFPETGHTISGLFFTYWNEHGGLAQQGYPISEELQEVSDTDGKTYTMQYFERAVFEKHPENAAPYNVLLSLLGTFYYNQKYTGNAPNQHTSTDNARKFTETGKSIGGAFRTYWEQHGGLAQQGYPVSDEFQEVSDTDGKTYTVQYFQRAVFEYHPELQGANKVLLSLLGVFSYNSKHGGGPQPTTQPQPTAQPTTQSGPTATTTPAPVGPTGQVLFFNANGLGQPALLDQNGTLFYQKTFQHNTPDWTHVASVGDGLLLFYKLAAGGRIGKLQSDGSYADIRVGIPYNGGWNQVTGIGNNQVVLFNSNTKKLVTEAIGADGSTTDLKTIDTDLAWSNVVGLGSGLVYLFLDDGMYIHKSIGKVDAQGTFSTIFAITERERASEPGTDWYILPLAVNHVMRYHVNTGHFYIEQIAPDGAITIGPQQSMAPNWNKFAYTGIARASGGHGVLLAYKSTTGEAITRAADADYNFTDLKSYTGPTVLSTGWTTITGIK